MFHEVVLKLICKRPEVVKKSLEPDVEDSEEMKTELKIVKLGEAGGDESYLEIRVKGKKLSHLKAIINSYLSIVSTLDEVEDAVRG